MAFQFSTGIVWMTPQATLGNAPTNPTPQQIGTVESISVDFSGSIKELVGFNQFPDDVAVAEKKVSGKVVFGRINAQLFNQTFFADSAAVGQTSMQYNQAASVPSMAAYTVTITPPNAGTFSADLGVIYASGANASARFVKVASGPAAGQYSQAGAVYTFAAADASAAVLISFSYNQAAAGNTYQINNQIMGYGPVIALDCLWGYQGGYSGAPNAIGMHLYAARISKIALAAKNNDYVKPELDFSAFANAAGQVGYFIQNAA